MISTRQAKPGDLEQVAALFNAYRQFYEQPADLALATQFIRARMHNRDSVILVVKPADASGPLAGFCQLYPSFCSVLAQPIYTLYDLFVAPEARKTGAGRALLMAAHAHASKHGFARLDLTTAKTNFAAQSLYQSLGWVCDEVYLGYNKSV